MSFSRFAIPRAAPVDSLLLAAVLASLNFWIAPNDWGWLHVNPSPYFLLPILIGGRFGFLPGVCAGAFTIAIIATGQFYLTKLDVVASLTSERYFFTCLVLTGGICGELQHFFNGRMKHLTELQEDFQHRIKKLDNELYFLREAKSEVDRIVATRDAGLCTLDAEIRELYLSDNEQFYQKVLALLNRRAYVGGAAIYSIGPETRLVREARIGKEDFLPNELALSEVEMASLAIEKKMAVTIADFWQRGDARPKPYLLSSPFLDADDCPVAVLMVTDMPFFALNQKSVHLIAVICQWTSRVIQVKKSAAGRFRLVDGVENQRIFSEQILRHNIDLAFHSYRTHNLPSTLILFSLPGMPLALQSSLERSIISCVRAGDCAAELDLGFPNLAVLLPLTGERIAKTVIGAALALLQKDDELSRSVEHRMFTFERSESGEELWQEIMDDAKATFGRAG